MAVIQFDGRLEIKTKAGTVIVTVLPDGDFQIETIQRKGSTTYFLRDVIHPDGQLKTF